METKTSDVMVAKAGEPPSPYSPVSPSKKKKKKKKKEAVDDTPLFLAGEIPEEEGVLER